MKEDARESAYEAVCLRLKDAERETVRLKGVVAVHRSKRERAEAVLDGLAEWVVKLSGFLRGESVFLSTARLREFSSCLVLTFALPCEVLAGRSREEEEAVQSELSRLDDPVVQATNAFWMDRTRTRRLLFFGFGWSGFPELLSTATGCLVGFSPSSTHCSMFRRRLKCFAACSPSLQSFVGWWIIKFMQGPAVLWRYSIVTGLG